MTSQPQPVAILGGTGPQGRGLAVRFARAGCAVTIGSRDASRAADIAAQTSTEGHPINGAANAAAAAGAEIVFVTVPWDAHAPTLMALGAELAGRIVVDVVNPMVFDDLGPRCIPVDEGSAAEQARRILPSSIIVAGFHHVSAKLLLDESRGIDTDVLVCGDDAEAKRRVMELAALIPGARPIDAGLLRMARCLEDMTAAILSVNKRYRTSAGIHLSGVDPERAKPS